MTTLARLRTHLLGALVLIGAGSFFALSPSQIDAQQKELPEVNILTAVNNMAFSAVWVAEQLKYFEQEIGRAHV